MPANNIYNDIYIVLIVLMIYFVIKLICTIRTRKSRVFISNAPKNIGNYIELDPNFLAII